jgi:hypothetical protein
MARTTFDRVTGLLLHLTDEELVAIKDRCTVLSKTGKQVIVRKKLKLDRPDETDWYAHGVGAYAISKGWTNKEQVGIVLSQKGIALLPDYHEKSTMMRRIVQGRIPEKLKQVQLELLGVQVVKAMALYIENVNERRLERWIETLGEEQPGEPVFRKPAQTHIDAYSLLAWVSWAPEAIEYQFPGYLASGLLWKVIGGVHGSKNT